MTLTQLIALAGLLCLFVAFLRVCFVLRHNLEDESVREDQPARDLVTAWMFAAMILQVVVLITG